VKSVMTDASQTFCVSRFVYLHVRSTYVLEDSVNDQTSTFFPDNIRVRN